MTVEAAIALAALIIVVVLCLGALSAAAAQVRCVDAAREAARLAARDADARSAALRVAPPGADVSIRTEGDHVIVVVSARVPILPVLTLHAEAIAVREPGEMSQG